MATVSFGIGWGLIWSPSTTAALSTLPPQDAGIASGSFVTIQEIGGTVGLAITVAVVRAFCVVFALTHFIKWRVIYHEKSLP